MVLPVCEPLISIALWLLLAVGAVALLGYYGMDLARRLGAQRGWGLTTLMAAAMTPPFVILLNPTWHERVPPPEGKPQLTVLADVSASMATPDGAGGRSRWDTARRIAENVSVQLGQRFDVQLRTFAAGSQVIDAAQLATIQPEGAVTDLAAALEQALATEKPQGQAVLLLSDGVHNAGGGEAAVVAVADRAKILSAPVYTHTIGGAAQVRDLAVDIPTPQDLAFVGQQTLLRVQLVPHGLAGGVTQLTLTLDGREIERRDVVLAADRMEEIEFQIRHDDSGVFRYEVHATALAGEATEANNSGTYVLRVVNEPIRVLLLEGKPYWDTKFLLRTLAADPSLEIVSVTRLAEGRFLERTLQRPPLATEQQAVAGAPAQPLPRTETWQAVSTAGGLLGSERPLDSFQVVVLGRDADTYLTDEMLAQLKRWLARDGGSLVCFRGTPTVQVSQRLATLLPVRASQSRETRFHLKLTQLGRELRWLPGGASPGDPLASLPSLATRAAAPQAQPLSVVWAVGEAAGGSESPAVTSMPYGTGRVVVLEGAGMWRWAFLPPQYQDHERIYGALWQSLTRWLVSNTGLLPTQTWALRADKITFDLGESATASLLVRETALAGGPPDVELSGDGLNAPRRLTPSPSGDEPGVFRVPFGRLPTGRYQALVVGSRPDDSGARTVFEIRQNVDEVVQVAANGRLMARVAAESGGAVLSSGSSEELSQRLEQHLARTHPEQSRVTTAWDRWWVLSGVFILWGTVWALRRSGGLV